MQKDSPAYIFVYPAPAEGGAEQTYSMCAAKYLCIFQSGYSLPTNSPILSLVAPPSTVAPKWLPLHPKAQPRSPGGNGLSPGKAPGPAMGFLRSALAILQSRAYNHPTVFSVLVFNITILGLSGLKGKKGRLQGCHSVVNKMSRYGLR